MSHTWSGATFAEAAAMMKGLAVIAVLLCGCDLYFGLGGGGDDVCVNGGGAIYPEPAYELRDPSTGVCQYIGGGGGGWCDDTCGPCPAYETDAIDAGAPALADWGACYGACSGLGEQSCFTTPGCFAAYLDDPNTDGGREFWGCWESAPSGPVQGSCTNLDAQQCSRHDDCIAVYSGVIDAMDTAYPGTKFQQCAPEPLTFCTSDAACGGDSFCDLTTCYPSPTCTECPTCGACPDSNTCYGVCVPKDCNSQNTCPVACEMLATEAACTARTDCTPVYDGDDCTCYPGYCECQVLTYARCETR